jgi:hypothetical protein
MPETGERGGRTFAIAIAIAIAIALTRAQLGLAGLFGAMSHGSDGVAC